jgi:hypothetical protein
VGVYNEVWHDGQRLKTMSLQLLLDGSSLRLCIHMKQQLYVMVLCFMPWYSSCTNLLPRFLSLCAVAIIISTQ